MALKYINCNICVKIYDLCEFVALLCSTLSLAGGIAQSKDDGPLVERRHVFNDLLGERSSDGSHTFSTNTSQFSDNDNDEYRISPFLGFCILVGKIC